MRRSVIAYLLALWPTLALADGFPIEPPLPVQVQVPYFDGGPRHIVRDGNVFFCPYPEFDPYCMLPNDYSWNLYGPPWRQRPPVISVPVLNSLLRQSPVRPLPPPVADPLEAQGSVDESRERVIQMGEEHCRRYPRDKICHQPKQ